MKGVMAPVPTELLAQRKRTGADRFDEMWEGVLHMPAMPNREHQGLEGELEGWLRHFWARPNKAKVYHQINLAKPGGWPHDYRIPDLLLLTPRRFAIDRNEYFEGPPDVVVELRSPGDESYEKLPWYAELGVPEVWIIHRDTKQPEVYIRHRAKYKTQPAAADGWVRSKLTGVELRVGRPAKLAVRLAGDDSTREELPED
jgi:Uma2 family endonuclease